MRKTGKRSPLEYKIGYRFKNAALLETALTHSSYANEQEYGEAESYERLEFLGDAILGFEIAVMIFKSNPNLNEGEMTVQRAMIVCSENLAQVARALGLGEYLRLGVGADKGTVRENDGVLEDAVEAIIAAVYLDGGIKASGKVIQKLFSGMIKNKSYVANESSDTDYKSRLQRRLQKKGNSRIRYQLLEESGPDHDKSFRVAVIYRGKELGIGEGKTKKNAEMMAAMKALEEMNCT